MANENAMNQGPVVPPEAEKKAEQGVKHARKAAKDLRSSAGAMANEYRGSLEEIRDDALAHSRFSERRQTICPREPHHGRLYRARGWFCARFDFPTLEGLSDQRR